MADSLTSHGVVRHSFRNDRGDEEQVRHKRRGDEEIEQVKFNRFVENPEIVGDAQRNTGWKGKCEDYLTTFHTFRGGWGDEKIRKIPVLELRK